MTSKTLVSLVFLLSVVGIGCNAGMAPSGMSREDAKNALANSSPEDQIRYYASSPMPQAQKEEHYKEIEAKYGVKASTVLGSAPRTGQ